jgi:hypothetical protein
MLFQTVLTLRSPNNYLKIQHGYSSLHFYKSVQNQLMFICHKLDPRMFFNLVGIEVFSKLFHLMYHLLKSSVTRYITRVEMKMMPSLKVDRCHLCFASVTSFFKLSFVFCGIIINQLLSQINNIRFFYLTMIFTVKYKPLLMESYFRNGTKVGGVWVYSVQNCIEEFQAEFHTLL